MLVCNLSADESGERPAETLTHCSVKYTCVALPQDMFQHGVQHSPAELVLCVSALAPESISQAEPAHQCTPVEALTFGQWFLIGITERVRERAPNRQCMKL